VTERKKQLRTADYPQEARERLGDAVAKARETGGWRFRTDFAEAARVAGEKLSLRSLGAVESGEAGVGQSVLFAIGRMLPNWTEDTPRLILEGGPIPSIEREPARGIEFTDLAPLDEILQADLDELKVIARMMARYIAKREQREPTIGDQERFMLWALQTRNNQRRIEPPAETNRDVS